MLKCYLKHLMVSDSALNGGSGGLVMMGDGSLVHCTSACGFNQEDYSIGLQFLPLD